MTENDTSAPEPPKAGTEPAAPPKTRVPKTGSRKAAVAEAAVPEGALPETVLPQPAPDPVPEPVAEPIPAPEPVPETFSDPLPPPPISRNRGALPAFALGGALAVAAGFALSHFDLLNLRPAPDDSALTALQTRAEALEAQLADTTTRLSTLESAPAPDSAALDSALAAQGEKITALETALAALGEVSPDGTVSAAQVAALAAEIDALKSQAAPDDAALRALVAEELARWQAEATEKLQAEAQATEAAAARAAALAQLKERAETGAPFADLLPALGEVPQTVSKHAETGLPPLVPAFADPARAALDAARQAEPGDTMGDRFLSFLKVQTGARSLTPQEGDGPDAVLSRAEAAVAAGEIQTALTEIATLPEPAQAELSGWVALAQDHIAFTDALAQLATPTE